MPFSNYEQLSPIFSEIVSLNPRSILDVGCGLGVYGMLCRIHLDLYNDPEFYRKLDGSRPWATRIDGIEGCEIYKSFIPSWAYDYIYTGNALDILPTIPDNHYDLILILAMIEHITQDEGKKLINQMKRTGRTIILSVPKKWQEQQITGYPLETHRSHWTEQDLKDIGFTRFLPHWGAWLAIYNTSTSYQPPDLGEAYHICSDQVKPHQGLTQVQKTTTKLCQDIVASLYRQLILDRLSFSFRIRSFKQRLKKMLCRHL